MIIGVILKQPIEVYDYDVDATPMFNGDGADFLDSTTVAITVDDVVSTDLLVTPVVASPTDIKLWISGGLHGVEYKVEVNAVSDAGRTKQDELMVIVEDI
jgi:hypothetical protein